ncbi:hypothetical protein STTU_6102 [Streptomyces sp. Tu6071]|nr:hypothetical protein STTU_6102 [Streptomyces sp. Tu6071]
MAEIDVVDPGSEWGAAPPAGDPTELPPAERPNIGERCHVHVVGHRGNLLVEAARAGMATASASRIRASRSAVVVIVIVLSQITVGRARV